MSHTISAAIICRQRLKRSVWLIRHAACATVLDGTGSGQYAKIVGWSKGTPVAGSCSSSPQPCREAGHTFCPTLEDKDQCKHPPKPCPPCPKAPPPPPGPAHNQTITLDRAFATTLDETSVLQLGTCHMMLLFHDNYCTPVMLSRFVHCPSR